MNSAPASGRIPDAVLKSALLSAAALTLGLLAWLLVSLVSQSGSAFTSYGPGFVFRNHWDVPAYVFTALPMLVGTLITAAIALILGVPVAIASALYLSELCPRRLRAPLTLAVDLLAAVPGVVYGLWGLFVLAPGLLGAERWFAATFSFIPWIGGGAAGGRLVTPTNYFVAGLILAIMIVPTVAAVARELIATVPVAAKQSVMAQGATRGQMIRRVILPRCRWGLAGAALLGLASALGETIAVVLVIGDNPNIGRHLFQGGYSLASVIASELGDAVGLQRAALFAVGLVLFVLTLAVNLAARAALSGGARCAAGPDLAPRPAGEPIALLSPAAPVPVTARRSAGERALSVLASVPVLVALVPLVLVIVALIRHGAAAITASFLTSDPTGNYLGPAGGARSAILGSLEIVLMAGLVSVPLGIGAALYLSEYGGDRHFATVVRAGVDALAGVPSILVGLFIYAALVLSGADGHSPAGWKGAMAVALVMLPRVTRSAERAFAAVPLSLREDACARGTARWRVLAKVVLPAALGGLAPGVLLALARGLGATAPLLFTAGAQNRLTVDPARAMNSLPTLIYGDITSTSHAMQDQAWAAALALVILALALTLTARGLSRRAVGTLS